MLRLNSWVFFCECFGKIFIMNDLIHQLEKDGKTFRLFMKIPVSKDLS